MYLSALERKRLFEIADARTRLFVTVLEHSRWFRPPAELYKQARVHPERARVELREFIRGGLLKPETRGLKGKNRLVRYLLTPIEHDRRSDDQHRSNTIGVSPIEHDRRSDEQHRSNTIGDSLKDPDLPSGEVVDDLNRPSVWEGVQGEGTDGRTELRESFRKKVADDWGLELRLVRPGLDRCAAKLTEPEIIAFLADLRERRGEAFSGLEHAQFAFGAGTSNDRIDLWLRLRKRKTRNVFVLECTCGEKLRIDRDKLARWEAQHPGKRASVTCAKCDERVRVVADTEDDALGELVRRVRGPL